MNSPNALSNSGSSTESTSAFDNSTIPSSPSHKVYLPMPIAKGLRKIRILSLEPGVGDDVLQGRLYKESLDNNGMEYAALSYSWSGSKDERMMYVNSTPFNITAILDSALRHFREVSRSKNIWVDAICINQSDHEEKSLQVALMADIYRSASLTWIWLGEGSMHSEVAMDFLNSFQPGVSNREGSKVHQIAMADFMQRRWWSRIWVVQEALLSRRPVFHYGNKTLELAPLLRYMRTGKDQVSRPTGHPRVLPITPKQPFLGILAGWHEYQQQLDNGGLPLHRLLYLTRDFKASVWRDRIFALLGLATAEARSWIVPEYSDNVSDLQILTRVTIYFLQVSLEPLRLAIRFPTGEGPSWVADWTCIDQVTVQNIDRNVRGLSCESFHHLEHVSRNKDHKDADEAKEILRWIRNCSESQNNKPVFQPALSELDYYEIPAGLVLHGYVLRRIANGNVILWPLQGASLYTLRKEEEDYWTLLSRKDNWSMSEYRRIYQMAHEESSQPEVFMVR